MLRNPSTSSLWPIVALACLAIVIASAAIVFAGQVVDQPRAVKADGPVLEAPVPPPGKSPFMGMRRCALCHNQCCHPLDAEISPEFCLMNEAMVFRTEDRHALAFEVLTGDLGKQIGRKLGFDVTEAKECLSCHAGWMHREEPEKPPSFASGVACEACHGASRNWDTDHSEPQWRKKPALDKERLGMIDVRDPVRRAELCCSCHIGSSSAGKVVTHKMYAAGHPPLPGFEVETYMAAMPPHWRRLSEKGDFQHRKEFEGETVEKEFSRTKSVLVGAIVAARMSLSLFAGQTGLRSESNGQPEFAMYDCQACHHELRSPAWRQSRNDQARPGRPMRAAWPRALVKVGLESLTSGAQAWKDVLSLEAKLGTALDEQPYGDPRAIIDVLGGENGLIDWLDKQAKELATTAITENIAQRALEQLYEPLASNVPDFHSARQIVWAIRAIETELRTIPRSPEFSIAGDRETPAERRTRVAQDVATYLLWRDESRQSTAEDVDRLLTPLPDYLQLVLPSRRKAITDDFLGPLLQRSAAYDPKEFRKLLQEAAARAGRAGPRGPRLTLLRTGRE